VKEVGDSRGRATVSGLREADSNRLDMAKRKKSETQKGTAKQKGRATRQSDDRLKSAAYREKSGSRLDKKSKELTKHVII
jgi:hypothetical protein